MCESQKERKEMETSFLEENSCVFLGVDGCSMARRSKKKKRVKMIRTDVQEADRKGGISNTLEEGKGRRRR